VSKIVERCKFVPSSGEPFYVNMELPLPTTHCIRGSPRRVDEDWNEEVRLFSRVEMMRGSSRWHEYHEVTQ
jgi:hypothetical protein